MTSPLEARIVSGLDRQVTAQVASFAAQLAAELGACAVLFYGSNLRTGSLDGVLDFYVLTRAPPERGIWPRVSFHEFAAGDLALRAKVANMSLAKFTQAASGDLFDTTIWARFVQPSVLVWCHDDTAKSDVVAAIAAAANTASRLAAVLGPQCACEDDFWIALFKATYQAEFRIETTGRAHSVLDMNRDHFAGLLPLGLSASGIACQQEGDLIRPGIDTALRRSVKRWWLVRRSLGKAINLVRLVRAASTFDGAARYAAWKIERHSGVKVRLTPWRERHPVLAAPGVMWSVWRQRRKRS